MQQVFSPRRMELRGTISNALARVLSTLQFHKPRWSVPEATVFIKSSIRLHQPSIRENSEVDLLASKPFSADRNRQNTLQTCCKTWHENWHPNVDLHWTTSSRSSVEYGQSAVLYFKTNCIAKMNKPTRRLTELQLQPKYSIAYNVAQTIGGSWESFFYCSFCFQLDVFLPLHCMNIRVKRVQFVAGADCVYIWEFTHTNLIEVHSCMDEHMNSVYKMNANELSCWGEDDDGESIG